MSDSLLFHVAFSVLKTEVRAMGRIVCWWAACLMEHRQTFIHTLLTYVVRTAFFVSPHLIYNDIRTTSVMKSAV